MTNQRGRQAPAATLFTGVILFLFGAGTSVTGLIALGLVATLVGAVWLAVTPRRPGPTGGGAETARPAAAARPVAAGPSQTEAAPRPRPVPEGWPIGKEARLTVFELWGQSGWPSMDIVGEQHHRDAIRDAFLRSGARSSEETQVEAVVFPEPSNPYDANAVRIDIDGRVVGYLPREVAVQYAPVLQELVLNGYAPVTTARIWATNDDGTWRARVTIDLAEPHLLRPANKMPPGRCAELPRGTTFQVSGEEAHLDVLAPYIGSYEAPLWVSLHPTTVVGPRSTKAAVEVHLDGDLIGMLSPAKAQEYTPLLTHLEAHGVTVVARARLSGNAVAANVAINAARASDVPQKWLDENTAAVDR